jgi:hypothetical protein
LDNLSPITELIYETLDTESIHFCLDLKVNFHE